MCDDFYNSRHNKFFTAVLKSVFLWYLRGKTIQLAAFTFNNSPITRLVALKCGSARELVISETLNNVWQTSANVGALR